MFTQIKAKYYYFKKEMAFLHRFISFYGLKRLLLGQTIVNPVRQRILTYSYRMNISDFTDLKAYLKSKDIRFKEGLFSLYLGPMEKNIIFPDLVKYYPPQSGIKIIKKFGEPKKIKYVNKEIYPDASKVALAHLPRPIEQVSLINYMADLNFFPNCYDVIRLKINENCIATAYIIENMDSHLLTKSECESFICSLENQLNKKDIGLTLPNWKNHKDFQCPNANSNLLKDKLSNQLKYVDFQNFFFVDKKRLLTRIIKEAEKDTEFAEIEWIMTGRGLYKFFSRISNIVNKTSAECFSNCVTMLNENGISLENRIVLDLDCNMGMILAESLHEGAWWAVGIDKANVIKHTRRILSLIGCSRISLFSHKLDGTIPLDKCIPNWISYDKVRESIIFVMARKHLDFASILTSAPWRAIVFKGNQNETVEETYKYMEVFASKAKARIRECKIYKDQKSTQRPIVLLVRN